MIWLITIVIFLGAVLAVMLVFWFLFQREQILAALRKPEQQRMEARIPTRVDLELSGPDEPLIYEITFTENVSRHGARVVTKKRLRPNACVLPFKTRAFPISKERAAGVSETQLKEVTQHADGKGIYNQPR